MHPRPAWLLFRSRRQLAYLGLTLWVASCTLLGAYLLADHLLTLPTPALTDPALHQAVAANRRPEQRDRWLVLHVLLESCKCSRQVLDHLMSGSRPADVVERVVLVTDDDASATRAASAVARARGFDVDAVAAEDLVARYRI